MPYKGCLEDFFMDLYQQETTVDDNEIRQYLEEEQFNEDAREHLGTPMTLEEEEGALNSLANGKAAGPDKIPLEFFKVIFRELSDELLEMFRAVQAGCQAPASWLTANIAVFLKKRTIQLSQALMNLSFMHRFWPLH
ncbi:hypothetical protein NDU88_003906 [Pleurodeles waltl]|uniref:Reverse transcriptase n=1 Tax=Pleurodeles waltl TaxID=8319 RepID=A0AAV7PB78_PLEWA|nr:hypothetical protein NDU88_003906 [Pleurodeles waltl]